jgi:chemotaxis protein MotB
MAKGKKHEEHVNTEAWAIPYGDLVTLLLALFVVLYSTSSVNQGKYRVLAESLVAAFRGQPSTSTPVQINKPASGKAGDTNMSGVRPTALMKMAVPKKAVEAQDSHDARSNAVGNTGVYPNPGTEPDRPDAKDHLPARAAGEAQEPPLQYMGNAIKRALADMIAKDAVRVRQGDHALEVELRTDVLFASGVAQLEPAARTTIQKIGEIIKPFPNTVRVEGHTDNRPIMTAVFPSNWELSAARAANVVQLFTQTGIDRERMMVVGFGENRPVADNATVEGRNANRRVIIVVSDEAKPGEDGESRDALTPSELAENAPAPGTPGTTVLSRVKARAETPSAPARPPVSFITLPPVGVGAVAPTGGGAPPAPSGGHH